LPPRNGGNGGGGGCIPGCARDSTGNLECRPIGDPRVPGPGRVTCWHPDCTHYDQRCNYIPPPPHRPPGGGGGGGSGGGGCVAIPPPDLGCVFVGTECRLFYQTCKYCCYNGRSYTRGCGGPSCDGWFGCVGWYDAPMCSPGL